VHVYNVPDFAIPAARYTQLLRGQLASLKDLAMLSRLLFLFLTRSVFALSLLPRVSIRGVYDDTGSLRESDVKSPGGSCLSWEEAWGAGDPLRFGADMPSKGALNYSGSFCRYV